jgi:hypothetical protein
VEYKLLDRPIGRAAGTPREIFYFGRTWVT